MKAKIDGFELWKLALPLGRVIGDCMCSYQSMDVLVLALRTDQGLTGWGFGETVSKGSFKKSAPWILLMPSLSELQRRFEREIWPILHGQNPFQVKTHRPDNFPEDSFLHLALRIALWDLMAQLVELPLYQFFGGNSGPTHVRAYASGLDFPLSEEEARELFSDFARRGFSAVKVKVGHPDPVRDLRRLRIVREAVGGNVEIAVDANEAWDCDQAIERIQFLQRENGPLAYVEDPLPRWDLEGLTRLNASVDVDVVGHDYIVEAKELERFVVQGAFSRLRVKGDPDHALECGKISMVSGVPLIFGNSMFELSVHAASALPNVDRIEFSDLAWNQVPIKPVRFENGWAIPPEQPGHGLTPDLEILKRFSQP